MSTASPAAALTQRYDDSSSQNELIYVGMVDVVGDGLGRVPVACYDGPLSNDFYYVLGNTSGLSDDYEIHGDSSTAGTGVDTMILIGTNGYTPPSSDYCASGSWRTGSWNVLSYNGFYLDLYGDGGNDWELDSGTASGLATYLMGGAGNDYLELNGSGGAAYGEAGADTIYALSGSGSGETLNGGSGSDCLWDASNSFSSFDCGADTDTRNNGNTGTSNCESSDPCCGFC
ncbi:MAG: hypothetical protein K8H88_25680 [Sandaracinaceae bacterium]|nr:hypothetical protein [Sandaracinaceae bacterium]